MISIESVQAKLIDYKDLLDIYVKDETIIVKPKRYIYEKEKWSSINSIVRTEFKGEWTSDKQKNIYEWHISAERKGNNGTYATLHCPYCGKTVDVSFKPRKEASR